MSTRQSTLSLLSGTCCLLAVAAAQPLVGTRPKFERRKVVERSSAWEPGDTLKVHNEFGNIRVGTWDRPMVRVRAELSAGGDAATDAAGCLRNILVTLDRADRVLSVRASCHNQCGATQYQVNLDLTLPEAAVSNLTNSYGDVAIEGLLASVRVQNRFGSTSIHHSGPAEVTNAFGDVNLAHVTGGATVDNQFGNINLHEVTGSCRVRNENGAVRLLGNQGRFQISNRMGEIAIVRSKGRFAVSGDQSNIVFEQSEVNADTVTIIDRDGAIHLTLPASPSARIEARAFDGQIESSIPATVTSAPEGPNQALNWTLGQGLGFFSLETSGSRIVVDAAR